MAGATNRALKAAGIPKATIATLRVEHGSGLSLRSALGIAHERGLPVGKAAEFRGVRFYVPKDTVEQGRNIIHHNYPDSNLRYDEDNGGHAPTFKVTAWLFGVGLPSQVKALHAALNKPGPGTRLSPTSDA
jgi:hypothetical protein